MKNCFIQKLYGFKEGKIWCINFCTVRLKKKNENELGNFETPQHTRKIDTLYLFSLP